MATLKDVAKEAGLTVTTVSRVLNNRGYISEDARKKVADAMKKLNYRPNELARSLHNKKTNTIGVIVPHIKHPYFAEMISSLEHEATEKGYKIMLFNSQNMPERIDEYIDICTNNRVAGIILCSGEVSVNAFSGLDIPVITMERFLDQGNASVECDNEMGGILAAERLIADGCKKILIIGKTDSIQLPADQREEAFKNVCRKKKIDFVEVDPGENDYREMVYSDFIEKAFQEHKDIDGLFASSDIIAAQALQVARRMGIDVPEKLKIIGFDDTIIASVTTPQLTTIHQPINEMAAQAIDLLMKAAKGEEIQKKTVLPVSLIVRETA